MLGAAVGAVDELEVGEAAGDVVDVTPGEAVGEAAGDEVGLAAGVAAGVGVGLAGAAVTLEVICARQTTTAPPPLPEPLHWLIVTGSAEFEVEVRTVQVTRIVPPPPLPESLHWVIVALVVLPIGLHDTVGAPPPPPPEPLHWLIVEGDVLAVPVTLLVTLTVHLTVPPPPLPEPLHWFTAVTRSPDVLVEVVQVGGAPWHPRTVTVEVVTPVPRLRLFVTVTSHSVVWPPMLSVPLHWAIATLAAAAGATSLTCQTPTLAATTSRANRRRRGRWSLGAALGRVKAGEVMSHVYPRIVTPV